MSDFLLQQLSRNKFFSKWYIFLPVKDWIERTNTCMRSTKQSTVDSYRTDGNDIRFSNVSGEAWKSADADCYEFKLLLKALARSEKIFLQ